MKRQLCKIFKKKNVMQFIVYLIDKYQMIFMFFAPWI